MSDDKTKTGKADRIRINVNQVFERQRWCKALGCTRERLIEVVKKVGPLVSDVKREMIEQIENAK